ncbi:MAG: hypothetical protein ND895_23625 [Pyrinomonadaceae bacterium]|nr:hypothetical protein [Pyrinomonadaceae bacterium]
MAEEQPVEPNVALSEVDKADKVLFIEKKVRYYGAEDVLPIYAELAAVRHTEHIFQLLFFQTVLPVTEDPKEYVKLEEIPARCLARIVIPPELMSDLYRAMGTNMEKRQKLLELKQKGVEAVPWEASEEEANK